MTARIVEKAGVAASVASAASADDAGVRARKTAAAVAAAAAPASSERACKDSTVGSSESDDMSHRLKRFQHNAPTANPSPADLTDGYGAALHKTDFHWVGTDEPHASRRKLILAKYPHIRDLYGYDHKTVWITLGLVTLQLTMAYLLRNSSVWFILPFAWAISGSSNSCLNMVVHECAHGLALKYRPYNAVLGMIANIPTCVPSSITFRRYHLDHHTSQGVDGVDVDLPTDLEGKYVRGRFLKALWLFFVPLFYTLRPMFVKPRSPILAENINQAFIITIDVLIYHFWGWRSLFYLFGGLWLGSSYHPSAAHFIAEHFGARG
ncbi:dihydroderamide delta-4 desaturase, variant [Capsaspora owczarzaki ATCC 30864]|uniref:Dihydroderamide delta-4 desaturase, variant n=1 Tax=Capsaspora owczarzaki (strain ATCC 30864) TaxID=595528 RepID=A0A0D2X5P3_CAPO3|nr:dihydroderamide delta-4 desaturase, variant [Capsaspora owczarzaki ATCC 30864]